MVSVKEKNYERRWPRKKREISDFQTTKINKEDIMRFLEICEGDKKLSYSRLTKYQYILKNLSKWADFDFREATQKDITKLVTKIREQDYSAETDKDYRVTLKYFFKVVYGDDQEYPDAVKRVKTTIGKHEEKKKKEPLRMEDIEKMLHTCNDPRDKAMLALAFESGARPSEYLTMQLQDVNDFEQIAERLTCKITVTGKTGARMIFLTDIAPTYLYQWKQKHPEKDNPEAILFPPHKRSSTNKPHLGLAAWRKKIREMCVEAGLNKRATPYWLRHSAVTRDVRDNISPSVAKAKFGWSRTSKQMETYTHLTGVDMVEMEKKRKGLSSTGEEKKENQKECWYCGTLNGFAEALCCECEKPLDIKDVKKREEDNVQQLEELKAQVQRLTKIVLEQKTP